MIRAILPTLLCLLAVSGLASARGPNERTLYEIVRANFDSLPAEARAHVLSYEGATGVRRTVQQTGTTNSTLAECERTHYPRSYWRNHGGAHDALFGTWLGRGYGDLLAGNATVNTTVIASQHIVDRWEITFNHNRGVMEWIDYFQPDSIPNNAPDHFVVYLQRNGETCTEIQSDDVAPHFSDREVDPLGLNGFYTALLDRRVDSVEDTAAPCMYTFRALPGGRRYDYIMADCIYLPNLGSAVPPGMVFRYHLELVKQ
jgi:hypothetical protein